MGVENGAAPCDNPAVPMWVQVLLILVWGAGCIAALWRYFPPGLIFYGAIATLVLTLTVLAHQG
jgi:hypothetical protein